MGNSKMETTIWSKIKGFIFFSLVIYSLYLGYKIDLPYIKFIPSTLSIVLIAALFFRKKWADVLGINANDLSNIDDVLIIHDDDDLDHIAKDLL